MVNSSQHLQRCQHSTDKDAIKSDLRMKFLLPQASDLSWDLTALYNSDSAELTACVSFLIDNANAIYNRSEGTLTIDGWPSSFVVGSKLPSPTDQAAPWFSASADDQRLRLDRSRRLCGFWHRPYLENSSLEIVSVHTVANGCRRYGLREPDSAADDDDDDDDMPDIAAIDHILDGPPSFRDFLDDLETIVTDKHISSYHVMALEMLQSYSSQGRSSGHAEIDNKTVVAFVKMSTDELRLSQIISKSANKRQKQLKVHANCRSGTATSTATSSGSLAKMLVLERILRITGVLTLSITSEC